MANTPQSGKRARQMIKRRLRGQSTRARCRTMTKKARAALSGEGFAGAYKDMQSALDGAAGKGILHRNTVARLKKRILRAHQTAKAAPKTAKAAS